MQELPFTFFLLRNVGGKSLGRVVWNVGGCSVENAVKCSAKCSARYTESILIG